jgi:hypothetical protein
VVTVVLPVVAEEVVVLLGPLQVLEILGATEPPGKFGL